MRRVIVPESLQLRVDTRCVEALVIQGCVNREDDDGVLVSCKARGNLSPELTRRRDVQVLQVVLGGAEMCIDILVS